MDKLVLRIAKLCADEDSRTTGLMDFRTLDDDECAFFIFTSKRAHPFWNKDVEYDLSLACIDERFCVVCFMELKAFSQDAIYPDSRDVKYVIEANRGVFEDHDVTKGDNVDFDPDEGTLTIRDHDSITSMYDFLKTR